MNVRQWDKEIVRREEGQLVCETDQRQGNRHLSGAQGNLTWLVVAAKQLSCFREVETSKFIYYKISPLSPLLPNLMFY